MSTAPRIDIDPAAFWQDPYPTLARFRKEAPIAFVPQLGSTLLCSRDDIFVSEKQIDVFSSHQPQGLMNKLMGHNMMRKDGDAHHERTQGDLSDDLAEDGEDALDRAVPGACRSHHRRARPAPSVDFVQAFALPFSAECLKSITGLTNMRFEDMNAWSQGMIDGIANYAGDPAIEARCNAATSGIDAAIDDMVPVLSKKPDLSLLGVMLECGMPMESVRANIKLAISGGRNEPRDAIAGTVWALLTHPDQLERVQSGAIPWLQAFEEYARWISPIGMSPRRIAKPWRIRDVAFEPEERVFLMFGSANRDEKHFDERRSVRRQPQCLKEHRLRRRPAFLRRRLGLARHGRRRRAARDLCAAEEFAAGRGAPPRIGGWAFRGLLDLPVTWDG